MRRKTKSAKALFSDQRRSGTLTHMSKHGKKRLRKAIR